MRALETEMEQAREPTKESLGQAPGTGAASRDPQREREPHFSPDPLHDTDRYRLVTPYRLSKD